MDHPLMMSLQNQCNSGQNVIKLTKTIKWNTLANTYTVKCRNRNQFRSRMFNFCPIPICLPKTERPKTELLDPLAQTFLGLRALNFMCIKHSRLEELLWISDVEVGCPCLKLGPSACLVFGTFLFVDVQILAFLLL